jgi:hypothetical protein
MIKIDKIKCKIYLAFGALQVEIVFFLLSYNRLRNNLSGRFGTMYVILENFYFCPNNPFTGNLTRLFDIL